MMYGGGEPGFVMLYHMNYGAAADLISGHIDKMVHFCASYGVKLI